jgi:cytochrome c oxidase subunit 2
LEETAPFDNPGVEEVAPNRYRITLRAKMWRFEPNEVEVPVGATVEFLVSSEDVIHGFWIGDTTVNAMVLPGEVTVVEHTFNEPGDYKIMCHEYCGLGHQTMSGVIHVVGDAESGADDSDADSNEGQG